MKMTEKLLEELSNKLNKVYDPKINNEITDIFINLVKRIKEDNRNYFSLAKKLAELHVKYEKLEKEKDQLKYDKEYFWKILREE